MERRPLVTPALPDTPKPERKRRLYTPLTAAKVRNLTADGLVSDGTTRGLYVRTQNEGRSKTYIYRFMMDRKRFEISIGPTSLYTLDEARTKAIALRRQVHEGVNPLHHKREEAAKRKVVITTFATVLDQYIVAHSPSWKNSTKQSDEWRNSLTKYAPSLMKLPVSQIDTPSILRVLKPLWERETKLGVRLRMRIEGVLSHAQAHGLIGSTVPNPARWKGHLSELLAKPSAVVDRVHHVAMDYKDVGAFLYKLRQETGSVARCLEFVILSGCRAGEVRTALWSDVDMHAKTLTISKERTKTSIEHVVPLTVQMLRVLEIQKPLARKNGLIFPARSYATPMMSENALFKMLGRMGYKGMTVHGFRSSFRTYLGDCTEVPRDLAEQCLGHKVGSAVEQAYSRGKTIDRRREVMRNWNDYTDVIQRTPLVLLEST